MKKFTSIIIYLILILIITSCSKSPMDKLIGEWKIIDEDSKIWFLDNGEYITNNGDEGSWEIISKEPVIVNFVDVDDSPYKMKMVFIDNDIISAELIGDQSYDYEFKLVRITEKDRKIEELVGQSNKNNNNDIMDAFMANVDAIEGVIRSAVTMHASETLMNTGKYLYPTANEVKISTMIEKGKIDDWIDEGNGVWTYMPTKTSLIYIQTGDGTGYKIDRR